MQRADRDDFGALGELIARAMYDNLNRFIVPNVAGPARLVPLAALVDEQFTLPALRQAAPPPAAEPPVLQSNQPDSGLADGSIDRAPWRQPRASPRQSGPLSPHYQVAVATTGRGHPEQPVLPQLGCH